MFKGSIMYKLIFTTLLTILLTACGGGSSTPTPPVVVAPPPPPPPAPSPKATDTTGVITGFGSVFINGVEYETDATEVSTDDNSSASETDLQVGMVVSLTGSVNDDGVTGTANSIHYEEQIKGPLDGIDLAGNSLVILGQTVLFDELTSLDNFLLIDLIPGDFLEISGFTNADGKLYATRISKEQNIDLLKVEGVVSQLDTTVQTFQLANLIINYASAEFSNFTMQDLSDGLAVRVKGNASDLVDGVFTVSKVKVETVENEYQEGDSRHLEGVITSFESSASFVVNDINVITNADTEYEHGNVDSLALNLRVKIKGEFDANNNLIASEIRVHQRTDLKIEGNVQSTNLENKTLTVLGVTFTTDQQTKMRDESDNGDRYFNLADLSNGDFVEVKGFVDNSGNNFATKLERKNEDSNTENEFKGTVSNIDSNAFTFMLVDVVVNTSEATLFEGLNGDNVDRSTFFGQLVDGFHIEVSGSVTDNIFTATKAKIEDESEDENGNENGNGNGNGNGGHRTEFRGIIESLADTSFVLSGHTVNILDSTEYEANNGTVSVEQFWALIKVGDQIKVKGDMDADGVITAKKMELEAESDDGNDNGDTGAEFSGTIESLTDTSFVASGHTVNITDSTEYKANNEILTFDQFWALLNVGDKVTVKGDMTTDGVITATKIELEND